MTDQPDSLFAREDTLLGVCEGLGEELGVPPIVFRVAFAIGLFWNPLAMGVAYLAVGFALALFRWQFPMRRTAAVVSDNAAPRESDNDDEAVPAAAAA